MTRNCKFEGCQTQPNYNIAGEKQAIFCFLHKTENMINVISKRCGFDGCQTQPAFNIAGEKRALFCFLHKTENMIDVISKRCGFEGCQTRPAFNIAGEKQAIFCFLHKTENMINVISKRCGFDGCQTQPAFNIAGEKQAIFCFLHKTENMIDVISKRCGFDGCQTQPNYNIAGEKQAIFCFLHKTENMIDVKNKTCKSTWCSTRVKDKYDGYCLLCTIHLFPDKKVARNYKTKERHVVDFIQEQFPDKTWIADKTVENGCSRRRPDLTVDLGNQIVIIEIDENQHTDYDCSCENKRLMEISQDFHHRNIVFIRFNPDEYTTTDNEKITSCWGNNNQGVCVVRKSKQTEWTNRLNVLKEQIQYWTENESSKMVEVVQLFYDQTPEITE